MSPEGTHKDTEKETDCETQTQNVPEAEKKAETLHKNKEIPRVEMTVRLHKHGFIRRNTMTYKILGLLSLFIAFLGCQETETVKIPAETLDHATITSIKEAKTYEGVDGNFLQHGKTGLGYWHAEIDVVFSQTPTDLEIVNMSTKHFMRDYKEHITFASARTDLTKYRWQDRGHNWHAIVDWEQTAEIVTLKIAFHGIDLFAPHWEASPLSYEQAKEKHPDIDWNDFVAYTLDLTLDWTTGRKRLQGIPIKPSEQILARF